MYTSSGEKLEQNHKMRKLTIIAGGLLLWSSSGLLAQTIIQDQSVTRYSDGSRSNSSSSTVIRDYDAERRQALAERQQALAEARERAQQQAEYARLAAEEKARAEQRWQAAIAAQNARHDAANGALTTQSKAVEPAQQPDSDAVIKAFIEANGYHDVSQTQIKKVRAYMIAHGLRHVSELGQ